MDYQSFFRAELDALKDSGNYREFAELERHTGAFPNATCHNGPGEVTITARQTFAVTFWASGAVEPQPDYVWTSEPVTFQVGELVAVNVNE